MTNPVLLLAKRFILSRHSDRFISMIGWVSVIGVSLGVVSLLVVTSVINGFEGELSRTITSMNGDILVYSSTEALPDAPGYIKKIKEVAPQTTAITPSLVTEVMLSGPSGVKGAVLEGVEAATIGQVTEIPTRFLSGRMPAAVDEIALGFSLAERIGAFEGAKIRVIFPEVLESQNQSAHAAAFEFKVSGLFKMGMNDYDSKISLARLDKVQEMLGAVGKVTTFKVKLTKGAPARLIAGQIREALGYPFRAKDWGQLNKNLFYAIELEKAVIAIILTAILIVAAFNIVSTLMMMTYDKAKEMAILRAMGFKKLSSFMLFSFIGVGIGGIGLLIGVPVALGLLEILARTKWIQLPADVYYIGYLPVVIKWAEVSIISGVTLLISWIATLYPAYQIATKSPLEGIRYS